MPHLCPDFRVKLMPINYLDGRKVTKSVQTLLTNFPDHAFIANEIYERLMQHKPDNFFPKDPLNLLQEYYWLTTEDQHLNYPDETFDLVVASLVPLWVRDLDDFFPEILRLLKPGGIFLLATLGVDTLKELRASFKLADDAKHIHQFYDMHDIGDKLLHSGFVEPVMDREHLLFSYSDVPALIRDLTQSGLRNSLVDQKKGWVTPRQWQNMLDFYKVTFSSESGYLATFEVIYGCAKKPSYRPQKMNAKAEVSVLVRDIKVR